MRCVAVSLTPALIIIRKMAPRAALVAKLSGGITKTTKLTRTGPKEVSKKVTIDTRSVSPPIDTTPEEIVFVNKRKRGSKNYFVHRHIGYPSKLKRMRDVQVNTRGL